MTALEQSMNSEQLGEQSILESLNRLKASVEGAIQWVRWDGRMVSLKDTDQPPGPHYNYQIGGFLIRDLSIPQTAQDDPFHPVHPTKDKK